MGTVLKANTEEGAKSAMPDTDWYDYDETDLADSFPTSLSDFDVGNFGFAWNALLGWVTEETTIFCNTRRHSSSQNNLVSIQTPHETRDLRKFQPQQEEMVFPPVDNVSIEYTRRAAFDSLIKKYVDRITSRVKVSAPIYTEIQLCVGTFKFRSPVEAFSNAQWSIIALTIIQALTHRIICEDFSKKFEENLDQLLEECNITRVELDLLTALLTGDSQ